MISQTVIHFLKFKSLVLNKVCFRNILICISRTEKKSVGIERLDYITSMSSWRKKGKCGGLKSGPSGLLSRQCALVLPPYLKPN